MQLVYRHRTIQSIGLLPITHPFVIIPLVPSRTDNGGCTRWQFGYNSKGVTFLQFFSIGSTDMVLVYGAELRFKNDTFPRSEEHTSELQSRENLVCRLLLEKKKRNRV